MPLPGNEFAWECFRDSLWQWKGSGFGDVTLDAMYVHALMGDRGVTGIARDEQMRKIKQLAEEFQSVQRVRAKRKKVATE